MAGSKRRPPGLNTFRPAVRKPPVGVVTLEIDALADDGRGIARVDGKTVFVANALPGESVKVRYRACHRQFDEADLVSIDRSSAQRITPLCRYFGVCGGCSLQHLDYQDQLQFKLEKLLGQLRRAKLGVDQITDAAITSPPFGYRHRARFSIAANRQGVQFGFQQAQSRRVVPIAHCALLQSELEAMITPLASLVGALRGRSAIDQLSVLEDARQQRAVWLRAGRPLPASDYQLLTEFAEQQQLLVGVHFTDDSSAADDPGDVSDRAESNQPADHTEYNGVGARSGRGRDAQQRQWWSDGDAPPLQYHLAAEQLTFHYRPGDFTQVNPAVNELLIARAVEWLALGADDRVLDLFCGIGNFSLPIAKRATAVTGIEISDEMVSRAAANARLNGVDNAHFRTADLGHGAIELPHPCHKALLDPPRAGAAAVCEQMAGLGIEGIVYVSCNPATFFRDAAILNAQGYQLERISLADMFPQTTHIELVASFQLRR